LGHTVGHAIEKVDHHLKSHGEYVLLGLEAEAYLLKDQLGKTYDEIVSATLACGVDCPDIDIKEVALACQKDKKNDETSISIMLADYENTKEIKLSLNEIYGGLEKWKSNR
jgi:3-dehydroquinate synthetase